MSNNSEKTDFRDLFARFKKKESEPANEPVSVEPTPSNLDVQVQIINSEKLYLIEQIAEETTIDSDVDPQLQNIKSETSELKKEIIEAYNKLDLKVEVIDLNVIEHYQDVPDYLDPTEIDKPLVMESEGKLYCLEGWSLIEAAQKDGKIYIECRIYHVQKHFDILMALKKSTIRDLPEGGFSSYSEMVRNINICINKLLNESDQFCKYRHGGDHKSSEFKNKEYVNVKDILILIYSKKKKSTLDNYVTHGEHLSIAVLNYLVDEEATAEFYTAFQTHKTDYVKRLQEQNDTLMEIQDKVSEKAKEKYIEFNTTKKINPFEDDEIRITIAEYIKQVNPIIDALVPQVKVNTPAKSTSAEFDPHKTIDEVISHLTTYKLQQLSVEMLIEKIKNEIEILQNFIVESYAAINLSKKKEDGQNG